MQPLAVYIHWPFCAAKCPYCDFNSHVRKSVDHDAWRDAFRKEIQFYRNHLGSRYVTSIFFGGGTPSLMEPQTAELIINEISRVWDVDENCEITLEANPTSIENDKFKAFAAAGINRVSIGVQSFRDDQLKFLGREHSAAEAMEAIKTAQKYFDRYSFDLIYARPGQTLESWREELTEALEYAEHHMSLYQLTIEKGTPFYMQHKRGDFSVPENDDAGALYEMTQEIMTARGLPLYEVSNHAAPGEESRHNMAYWTYADYVGIGPGAHGRITVDDKKWATRGHAAPEIWLEKVAVQGHGGHPFREISRSEQFTERFMMGLRTIKGIDLSSVDKTVFNERVDQDRISAMAREGYLTQTDTSLIATPAGLQRLNALLSYLL